MKKLDLNGLSGDEIASLVKGISAEEMHSDAAQLDPIHIQAVLLGIGEDREKIHALVGGLVSSEQLEAVGRFLTLSQISYVLDQSFDFRQMNPIFVGLPFYRFLEVLEFSSKSQLEALKKESRSEAMHHHLANCCHALHKTLNEKILLAQQLRDQIRDFVAADIGQREYFDLKDKINTFSNWAEHTIFTTDRALSIAWNTNRIDLIEKLNEIKDGCQKFLLHLIGNPHSQHFPGSLFAQLENQLNSVYGDPLNPEDVEALSDNDPAVDALAKFSIWYLIDYWKIGLLPAIKSEEELDACAAGKENLFEKVQENLKKIGLATVRDLKQAHIFSKEMLYDYIEKHKHLMSASCS